MSQINKTTILKGDPTKSVILLNFDKIQDSMIKLNKDFAKKAVEAMETVGLAMQSQIQDRTPVDIGNLKGAIQPDDVKVTGDVISVDITSGGVEYAEAVEFGYKDNREVSYNVEGIRDVISTDGARMFTKTIDNRTDNAELQDILINSLQI